MPPSGSLLTPIVLSLGCLAAAIGPGCRRPASPEEAQGALHRKLADLEDLLRAGPPTRVVAGPGDPEAPFLVDGSRWAAEELARVLREEGYASLLGSKTQPPARPVVVAEVVTPAAARERDDASRPSDARLTLFVTLRSVELLRSTPRHLEWTYDGSIEIHPTDRDGHVTWDVSGSSESELPNSVPQDPDAARRPLAERWARQAFRVGAMALGAFGPALD